MRDPRHAPDTTIALQLHYRRPDGLATYAEAVLQWAALLGAPLPIVRCTGRNYRVTDGRLGGELVGPRDCPPLMLCQVGLDDDQEALLHVALLAGYRLDTGGEALVSW